MIDWTRVMELRDEVGPSEFEPVLELFMDEVEEIVMRLSHSDPAKLARDLHFLKGSAWNLGFSEFGSLCQSTETRCLRDKPADLCVREIITCYARSKQLFMRDLARMVDDRENGQAGVA